MGIRRWGLAAWVINGPWNSGGAPYSIHAVSCTAYSYGVDSATKPRNTDARPHCECGCRTTPRGAISQMGFQSCPNNLSMSLTDSVATRLHHSGQGRPAKQPWKWLPRLMVPTMLLHYGINSVIGTSKAGIPGFAQGTDSPTRLTMISTHPRSRQAGGVPILQNCWRCRKPMRHGSGKGAPRGSSPCFALFFPR